LEGGGLMVLGFKKRGFNVPFREFNFFVRDRVSTMNIQGCSSVVALVGAVFCQIIGPIFTKAGEHRTFGSPKRELKSQKNLKLRSF